MNEVRAPTNDAIREQVLEEYRNGMKPKALSEKTGISINTIKSWIKRDKGKKVEEKKEAPQKKKGAPRSGKKGAPLGNHNARGNRGGAAPVGNKNAEKHGAYSRVYWDSIDAEEMEMIEGVGEDAEEELIQQIQLFSIRERRLMIRIKRYREMENENHGMAISSISKVRNVENLLDSEGKRLNIDKVSEHTTTHTAAVMTSIMTLESELTKVQRAKTKAIESLAKLRNERDKFAIEQKKEKREAGLYALRKELLDAQIEHMDAQTNKLLGTDTDLEDTSETDDMIYNSALESDGGADDEE